MSYPILDTTVIVHVLRACPSALDWLATHQSYAITPITWLEVMAGVGNKAQQVQTETFLSQFDMAYLTAEDQQWAMRQFNLHYFKYRIGMNDCMIASAVYRLQVPLYTHNMKHMRPLLGEQAIRPYL